VHAAVIRVELKIPGVRSLKEKRRIVKSLIANLTNTHPLSVAEVDHQDLWQRSTIGIAVVASSSIHLERLVHVVERDLNRRTDIDVLSVSVSHLEPPA